MKKRIYFNMMLLTVISLLLAAAALCFVFYSQFTREVRGEVKARADIFDNMTLQTALTELKTFKPADMRITLIYADGSVAYDNMAPIEGLKTHIDREEVQEALETGVGESKRYSATLGQQTYYYAVKLADGSILRIAKTTSSIVGVFSKSLPIVIGVVLAMVIIGYLLAGRLTKRIVAPLNSVDFSGGVFAPYDELAPFVHTIERQRNHIAQQLADEQSRTATIAAVMDNMREGIVIVNPQGVVMSVNRSALDIFEAGAAMDGRNILELIRDVELLQNVRAALGGERGEMNLEQNGKSYHAFFSPVADSGAIILLLDITPKMLAEKMRREFSANVSHELKTPLTSIYGHAEMLAGGMVKENDRDVFYEKIKHEAARLIALVEDVIMISELDEGKGHIAFEQVDVAAVAAETAEALALKAAENGVKITVSGGAKMAANRSMVYEMFYNLIENAIKYNKPGGAVQVDISQTAQQVKITVADTGIGIPEEEQGRVFERFYRVDKSRSKKTGGTGLGLAIVKHIVMVHGGDIALSSTKNAGTTMAITFNANSLNAG